MIGALFADQQQISDRVARQEIRDPSGPFIRPAGKINAARGAPENPVPLMQIDALHLMAKRPQPFRHLGKKR